MVKFAAKKIHNPIFEEETSVKPGQSLTLA
jgi:hypothetical protein